MIQHQHLQQVWQQQQQLAAVPAPSQQQHFIHLQQQQQQQLQQVGGTPLTFVTAASIGPQETVMNPSGMAPTEFNCLSCAGRSYKVKAWRSGIIWREHLFSRPPEEVQLQSAH